MNTLCLQLTESLSPSEIVKKINKNKIFIPQKVQPSQEKIKGTLGGTKVKIRRQYSCQLIKIKNMPDVEMRLEVGVASIEEQVMRQCDIYLTYDQGQMAQVEKILNLLSGALSLILVEPRLDFRLGQEQGSFSPLQMPCYRTGKIWGGIWAHIVWQVYILNATWLKYLANPKDKVVLRQLRIKLRRLRSCLSFFRPAFKLAPCTKWQNILRQQGLELGKLRELDVMLMTIVRMNEATNGNEQQPSKLQDIFAQKRDKQLTKMLKDNHISKQTVVLAKFLLWLQTEPLQPEYEKEDFNKFIVHRFKVWSKKILGLMEGSPDFSDMTKAHKTRIEIKKFRYVLLSFKEINKDALNLLRKLKRLQDVLGFLHDDYINGNLVKNMAAKGKGLSEYEAALFAGWESAKVESSIDTLRDLSLDFCTELRDWRDSLTTEKQKQKKEKALARNTFPL